jgi:2-aminoadipate transaminase
MTKFHASTIPKRHGGENNEVLARCAPGSLICAIMNWNHCFAQRTGLMRRNAVRELLKVASRPEVISLAGGLPAAELFPMDRIRGALATVLDRVGNRSLQYAETEGISELRAWIARGFTRPELRVKPENVLITSGGQQALDLLGRVFLDPDDLVVVENPTYLALLSAWRPHNARFYAVTSDHQGMKVDELKEAMNPAPKLIYLVPNFQNPQGTTLSQERRRELVHWLCETKTILVEDNPYGELRYEGSSLPHLFELAASTGAAGQLDSQVIYTGSFSKVLMPGLRLGWVIAPEEVIEKLVLAKQAADLHSGTLSQYLALELVSQGFLDEQLPRLRHAYRERRDAMLSALAQHFPDTASWSYPEGGMFLLARLREIRDTSALLPMAIENKVAYVPGEEFHVNGSGRNTLRLNFSSSPPARIAEGIKRLAAVVRSSG